MSRKLRAFAQSRLRVFAIPLQGVTGTVVPAGSRSRSSAWSFRCFRKGSAEQICSHNAATATPASSDGALPFSIVIRSQVALLALLLLVFALLVRPDCLKQLQQRSET